MELLCLKGADISVLSLCGVYVCGFSWLNVLFSAERSVC